MSELSRQCDSHCVSEISRWIRKSTRSSTVRRIARVISSESIADSPCSFAMRRASSVSVRFAHVANGSASNSAALFHACISSSEHRKLIAFSAIRTLLTSCFTNASLYRDMNCDRSVKEKLKTAIDMRITPHIFRRVGHGSAWSGRNFSRMHQAGSFGRSLPARGSRLFLRTRKGQV